MLNDMKITTKLIAGFGLLILLMCAIALFSEVQFKRINHVFHGAEKNTQLQTEILKRITDHVAWVSKVKDLFADERISELTVETDPKNCALGKWLNSEEAKQVALESPDLKKLFEAIAAPHERLHASAIRISEDYRRNEHAETKKALLLESKNMDGIAKTFTATLLKAMDEVIDPAKEKAENERDIAAMIQWNEIDMKMNEVIIAAFLQTRIELEKLASFPTEAQWQNYQARLEETGKGIADWTKLVEGNEHLNDTAKTITLQLDSVKTIGETYHKALTNQENANASMKKALKTLQEEAIPAANETITILTQIRDILSEKAAMAADQVDQEIGRTVALEWIIAVFGVLLGILGGIFISRSIVHPIRKVIQFAEGLKTGNLSERLSTGKNETGVMGAALNAVVDGLRNKARIAAQIAEGDLKQEIQVSSENDILGKALNTMIRNLNAIVTDLLTAAEQVDAGSMQVSDSSQALSQSATQQASSLEEISSTITQISHQTKTNAENASQATRLAESVCDLGKNGAEQMTEMTGAMKEISESSREIDKIIKTIDSIAFQTNLLALNAAVEAARAGKHGKGFAVVAQEVRTLAARSSKAAKETEELIAKSGQRVENGNLIVEKTGKALLEINEGVAKVTDIVKEIAASSNEQAQGISQINQGLVQIDGVTQQNTANAEETSSAAIELSSQASQVRSLLSRFKLKGHASKEDGYPPRAQAKITIQKIPQIPFSGGESWGKPERRIGNAPRQDVASEPLAPDNQA